ncbi:MAG TPA: lamin tail domain-containing protein, partial [Lacipirellulaceae bacterium]|nr:lamin tail domain-containing protein [Lacipirellulaceae bacterium]
NVYQIEGGAGDSSNQAPDQPTDGSDWNALRAQMQSGAASEAFWRSNVNLDVYYAFDAITRATSNVDVRPGDNYIAYHAPDGRWQIIPWDLDMMYIPETHQTGSTYLSTYFSNARLVPQLQLEFKNRARELLDLMFSDASRTGGQVAQLVDEFARMVNPSNGAGGYLTGWAELDQYLWNYHPRTTADHRGQFYANPSSETMFGGTYVRNLATADFSGMVQWVINFMTDTDPDGWSVGDGDQRGYGFNYLEAEAFDATIPARPTISYAGAPGYPVDGLQFATSAFSDPNGHAFAKMEWRIGEISNPSSPGFDASAPWKYEVDAVWESGEQASFASGVSVPTGALAEGRTYRARVRMQDSTGRWSHWSAPVEFVAGPGDQSPALVITELHYNPVPDHEVVLGDVQDLEFIELMNTGATAADISGMQITTFSSTPYVFAAGTTLAPGGRIVVANDVAAFRAVYGGGVNLAATGFDGNLSNGGETIALATAGGTEFFTLTFDDAGGWPTAADGGGPSLEMIDPAGPANAASNWRASAMLGGSPGWDGGAVLEGDYDRNGVVNGNDFVVWQRQLGSRSPALLGPDGSGNREVDAADLTVWSGSFGATEHVAAAVAAADEPASGGVERRAALDFGGWIFVADGGGARRPRPAARPKLEEPPAPADRALHADAVWETLPAGRRRGLTRVDSAEASRLAESIDGESLKIAWDEAFAR